MSRSARPRPSGDNYIYIHLRKAIFVHVTRKETLEEAYRILPASAQIVAARALLQLERPRSERMTACELICFPARNGLRRA